MTKIELKRKVLLLGLVILLVAITLVGCSEEEPSKPSVNLSKALSGKIAIHFIDVGQADATLIQLPNEENMLIDAGNNTGGQQVVNYIKELKIDKIDYLIATHPHEDHIGGLDNVINNFNIGKIYMPKVTHTTETFRDLLVTIKKNEKEIITAEAGKELVSKDKLGVRLLGPIKAYDNLNNWSAVVKVRHGTNSFLFTGDIEAEAERDTVDAGLNLQADLLKIAHHGSSSSTVKSFLEAVDPKYSVISVGADNDYGHPSPFILQRLKEYGVKTYRTDKQGTIIVVSDGEKITFNQEPIEVKLGNRTVNSKAKVRLIDLNLRKEEVVIKNNSKEVIDLSGWKLLSIRGSQKFIFPEDSLIKPKSEFKVVSGRDAKAGTNRVIWTKGYIWNNKGDAVALYDTNQNLVSELSRY